MMKRMNYYIYIYILSNRTYQDVHRSMDLFNKIMNNQEVINPWDEKEPYIPPQTHYDVFETHGFDHENPYMKQQINQTSADLRSKDQTPMNRKFVYDPEEERWVEKERCIIL